MLIGFSQGAALSLMTALTTLHELGGVASLSGWTPQQSRQVSVSAPSSEENSTEWLSQAMQQIEPNLPVFWAHGTADEEVPMSYGEECTAFLRNILQFPADKVTFKTYEGLEHAVNEDVVNDLVAWLARILT